MYEHSYHLNFGTKAGSYVGTFMQAVHWANADRPYALATGHVASAVR
jgi:Fe-Mn family superoxide dismutase